MEAKAMIEKVDHNIKKRGKEMKVTCSGRMEPRLRNKLMR